MTPGESAYVGFMQHRLHFAADLAARWYTYLSVDERATWEAAAQAVLALKEVAHVETRAP